MFMLLFNSHFTEKQLKVNYEYYEPRCIHESSLSPSVHSIFVLTLLCVQSCIKEDIVPCKDNTLLLKFGYTLNNRYTNLFGSDVSEIAVYIFDDKGRYLEMSSEA